MEGELKGDVTRWLAEWRAGDDSALERLIPRVYGELRRVAGRHLNHERAGHTFQTHDLIHEAFLRLVDQRQVDWRNRNHFFAIAARLMRRILVDHARSRKYGKRGGGAPHVNLDAVPDLALPADLDLVALDEALTDLARTDETLARIVDLRFFGGLEYDEIAGLLGVSAPTVGRRWRTARAWLYHRLRRDAAGDPGED